MQQNFTIQWEPYLIQLLFTNLILSKTEENSDKILWQYNKKAKTKLKLMMIYLMQLIEDSKIESTEFQHLELMIDRNPPKIVQGFQ